MEPYLDQKWGQPSENKCVRPFFDISTKKWSENGVFCTFLCASRHNGVQFFISPLRFCAYFSTLRSHKSLEKHSELRFPNKTKANRKMVVKGRETLSRVAKVVDLPPKKVGRHSQRPLMLADATTVVAMGHWKRDCRKF